jgi:hypothetical protein
VQGLVILIDTSSVAVAPISVKLLSLKVATSYAVRLKFCVLHHSASLSASVIGNLLYDKQREIDDTHQKIRQMRLIA